MNKIVTLASIASIVVLSACSAFRLPNSMRGSGNVITESRPVSGIDAVALAGFGELQISQSGTESLTIEGDDNILPLIITEVRDGKLTIGFRPNTGLVNATRLRYVLNVNALDRIELSGAGVIKADGLSGSELTVTSSGAGSITTSGKVADQSVTVSGAGSYDGLNLETENTTVQISGLGGADVWATDALDVNISGAGSVKYIGDPQVSRQISGAGTVGPLER